MFDDLLNLVFRAADVRPSYAKTRCLAVRQSPAACTRCADVCPHEAVEVKSKGVTLNDVDCTGCGLCVQACPSQALEPKVRLAVGRPTKCSRVEGDAQTVHCLGRLRPTDLHKLLRGRATLILAHGDCADCPIGTPDVLERLDEVVASARELLELRGVEREIRVERRDTLADDETAERFDRRALLRGGWRNLASGTSDALAPLDPGGDEGEVPYEAARTWRALELADPPPEREVPWPIPRVDDRCILCPICTRVCPTDAFSRAYDDDGGGALVLDPSRCIGCDACVGACPVDAIGMERRPTWSELSRGPTEVYRRPGRGRDDGSVER